MGRPLRLKAWRRARGAQQARWAGCQSLLSVDSNARQFAVLSPDATPILDRRDRSPKSTPGRYAMRSAHDGTSRWPTRSAARQSTGSTHTTRNLIGVEGRLTYYSARHPLRPTAVGIGAPYRPRKSSTFRSGGEVDASTVICHRGDHCAGITVWRADQRNRLCASLHTRLSLRLQSLHLLLRPHRGATPRFRCWVRPATGAVAHARSAALTPTTQGMHKVVMPKKVSRLSTSIPRRRARSRPSRAHKGALRKAGFQRTRARPAATSHRSQESGIAPEA
jgi:hypothetical protein